MNCPACGAPALPGDLICQSCGANLARRGARPAAPPPPDPAQGGPHDAPPQGAPPHGAPPQGGQPYDAPPQGAPRHGGQPYGAPQGPPVHRPGAPPAAPGEPDAEGPSTLAWSPFCPHCGADVPDLSHVTCVECLRPLVREKKQVTSLRVTFPTGEVGCAAGEELPLGRDESQSRVAGMFRRFDNVSRRHATIGLDHAGRAWVRDERSTNGTFVNDGRLEPGAEASLSDGDDLRLAADVTGRVRLG